MRIFISSIPYSFKLEIRAFRVNPDKLKSVRIVLTKEEIKYSNVGGAWQLFYMRLKQFEKDVEGYHYIGCLGEYDKKFSYFTAYYTENWTNAVEIPLPSKKELKRLELT